MPGSHITGIFNHRLWIHGSYLSSQPVFWGYPLLTDLNRGFDDPHHQHGE